MHFIAGLSNPCLDRQSSQKPAKGSYFDIDLYSAPVVLDVKSNQA